MMSPPMHLRVRRFLLQTFTAEELRIFLADVFGREILHRIDLGGTTEAVFDSAVCLLDRQGLLGDDFFAALVRRFPNKYECIREIAGEMGVRVAEMNLLQPREGMVTARPVVSRPYLAIPIVWLPLIVLIAYATREHEHQGLFTLAAVLIGPIAFAALWLRQRSSLCVSVGGAVLLLRQAPSATISTVKSGATSLLPGVSLTAPAQVALAVGITATVVVPGYASPERKRPSSSVDVRSAPAAQPSPKRERGSRPRKSTATKIDLQGISASTLPIGALDVEDTQAAWDGIISSVDGWMRAVGSYAYTSSELGESGESLMHHSVGAELVPASIRSSGELGSWRTASLGGLSASRRGTLAESISGASELENEKDLESNDAKSEQRRRKCPRGLEPHPGSDSRSDVVRGVPLLGVDDEPRDPPCTWAKVKSRRPSMPAGDGNATESQVPAEEAEEDDPLLPVETGGATGLL